MKVVKKWSLDMSVLQVGQSLLIIIPLEIMVSMTAGQKFQMVD